MMINGVSFTGRETMLTAGLKSVGRHTTKSGESLSFRFLPVAESRKAVQKAIYESPFRPVEVLNSGSKVGELTPAQKMEMSYAVSHGTPEGQAVTTIDFIG